jgi:hypothetical protein
MTASNIANIGYAVSKSLEQGIELGFKVLEACPTYLEEIPKEFKEELMKGIMTRYFELHPTVHYTTNWVESPKPSANKLDVHIAMALGSVEFGKLKTENAVKHGLYASVRKGFQDYSGQVMNRLRDYVVDAKNVKEGKSKTRKPNISFLEYLFKIEVDAKKKIANAKSKNDSSIDISQPLYNDLLEVFKKHNKIKPKN